MPKRTSPALQSHGLHPVWASLWHLEFAKSVGKMCISRLCALVGRFVCLCVFRNAWWVLFLVLFKSSSSDLLPHNHPTPLLSSRCFCWSVPPLDWQLLVHQAIPATANARCQHQTQHHLHCHHHRHRHYHRHHHHHYSSKDFTRKMIGFLVAYNK